MHDQRNRYLAGCETRWNNALEDLKEIHTRYPRELELLISNWEAFSFNIGFCLPGEMKSLSYQFGYTVIDAMEFLRFFISHEIHDDGEPTLMFVKREFNDLNEQIYVSTSINDPKAHGLLVHLDKWHINSWLANNPLDDFTLHGFNYDPELAEYADLETLTVAIKQAKKDRKYYKRECIELGMATEKEFEESLVQKDLKAILLWIKETS